MFEGKNNRLMANPVRARSSRKFTRLECRSTKLQSSFNAALKSNEFIFCVRQTTNTSMQTRKATCR